MAKIIKHPEHKEKIDYFLVYSRPDGSGFSFNCDEKGKPVSRMHPIGKQNYQDCIEGLNGTTFKGLQSFRRHWLEYAVLECDCGRHVELSDGLDNFCDCGACYNMSGQRVIPSSESEEYDYYDHDY